MTICNYCLLRRMKVAAGMRKEEVTLKRTWSHGYDVYVHPPSVTITNRKECEQYWRAWVMAIPEECAC